MREFNGAVNRQRDLDLAMERTSHRPTVTHALTSAQCLAFGFALAAGSFAVLWGAFNLLAAMMAMAGLLFYFFIYTMALKRRTPQNIVIGGAAGAFPPLVGYAAVTGTLDPIAWYLFAIIFLWTPVHFWALALLIKDDYARAGVPMMPVVRGDAETARQIVLYTLLLFAVSLLLFPTAEMGLIYLVAAVGLGAAFVWYAVRVLRDASDGKAAIGLFRYSISYLTLLFAAVAIDSLIRLQP